MENIKYNKEDLEDHHATAGIIKNKKGEVLMQEHIKYGFWTIPIGKIKPGQDIEEGFKEEMLEECNAIVEESKEILAKEKEYIRNGKKVKVIEHIFEITKYSGKIENKEPDKHSRQEFLSIEEIKALPHLSNSTLDYLETLGIKRKTKV